MRVGDVGARLLEHLGRLQLVEDLQRTGTGVPKLEATILVSGNYDLRIAARRRRPLATGYWPFALREAALFTCRCATNLYGLGFKIEDMAYWTKDKEHLLNRKQEPNPMGNRLNMCNM